VENKFGVVVDVVKEVPNAGVVAVGVPNRDGVLVGAVAVVAPKGLLNGLAGVVVPNDEEVVPKGLVEGVVVWVAPNGELKGLPPVEVVPIVKDGGVVPKRDGVEVGAVAVVPKGVEVVDKEGNVVPPNPPPKDGVVVVVVAGCPKVVVVPNDGEAPKPNIIKLAHMK
jgi:hypothetical protein